MPVVTRFEAADPLVRFVSDLVDQTPLAGGLLFPRHFAQPLVLAGADAQQLYRWLSGS